MPLARLLTSQLDLYAHTLSYHSFTDLLTLLSTSRPLRASLAHSRTRTGLLRSACRLVAGQRAALDGEADVWALLVVLSCVERRLLSGGTIAPLHLSLLVQSLLGTALSTTSASGSVSAQRSFAASARSVVSSALSSSSPFLARYFSPTLAAADLATNADSATSLSSCPTLQSLSQPHLSLWLCNPFQSPRFLAEWAAQHKPPYPADPASSQPPSTCQLSPIRDALSSRVVWLGSWRDDRQSLSCFGLYLGAIDRTRDAQHRFDLRQLPATSAADCRTRLCDASASWDELPVVSLDLGWSMDDVGGGGSMPPLLYFPSLTAFLLSVSSFASGNAASELRSLLCGLQGQQTLADEDGLESLSCCGRSWRWWAGCLVGECGRHMLPTE